MEKVIATSTEILAENHEFNLSDFALFLSVMRQKEAYQNVLSIIMDEEDLELEQVEVEQVILNKNGKRAIRLDAWARDVKTRRFNTEMQNDIKNDDVKIFLNMTSKVGRPELVSLLQYMKNTSIDNPEILVKDRRIEELDDIVSEVKQSEEWGAVRMNILEIGIEKGIEKGIIDLICKKLRKGKSVECIADEVEEAYDRVSQICAIAEKYAPDYDQNKVFEDFCKIGK